MERLQGDVDVERGRIDPLPALLEIVRRLRRPFNLEDLLDEILNVCRDLLDAEAATLLLADESETKLTFHAAKGGRQEALATVEPLQIGEGIAGWVAEHRCRVNVQDAAQDERFSGRVDRDLDFTTRSILAAPLQTEGRLIGVIEAINKHSEGGFGSADEVLLDLLAEQAAHAIESVCVSERRRHEDRLAVVGRMASSIIHDLKNPMAAIQGYAHLLAKQHPDNRRYAEIIVAEIDRLVAMTRELLDFSKGTRSLHLQRVGVGDFLRDVASFLERDLENRGVELLLDVGFEGQLSMDSGRMRRVLFNLTGNATDAMPEGGRVTLASRLEGEEVRIDVSDTGSGMDELTQNKLFTPFFSTKGGSGTGLGTTIVHSIIESHGGRIEVQSAVGVGTTFSLFLPA